MSGINPGESAMDKKVVDKQNDLPQGSEEVLKGPSNEDLQSQETRTPSHGFDAVKWEGVREAASTASQTELATHRDSPATEGDRPIVGDPITSERLLQVVEDRKLIASQKMLLVVVIMEMGGNERISLTYEELAARSGMARRVVAEHIPTLESLGWIKRVKNARSYDYEYTMKKI